MRFLIFIFLSISATILQAQDFIYSKSDSLFITNILQKYKIEKETDNIILSIACEFLGHKYTAGTLERGSNEPLVISSSEVDCTTFVELVLAIYLSVRNGEKDFIAVCNNLEKIRYRDGRRNGYASRLHYMSQWIADKGKEGIIIESTHCAYSKKKKLNLDFMSRNPANYELLRNNPALVREIEKWEEPFRNIEVEYIPKEELARPQEELPVKEGDIIVLTTNIEGLDVVHTGFAFWQNDKLHLLHASSIEEKVIKDEKSLYDYQKSKKKQTGIRVFSIVQN